MDKVRLALVGALVLGLTAAARAGKEEPKPGKGDIQKKLVGKWQVVKSTGEKGGPPPGATIEFTRDGKILVTADAEGKKVRREATYEVEGKGFKMTIKHGDREHTETIKVLKADEKELVLRGEKDGHRLTLKRKAKKED
jgi:uncharacterized protein (TIGR03066 family)